MMTCCRHDRTEYIGSRRTPGLIAVHCRPGSRHGRYDGHRTTRGRELDRRCACEEAAKGRFHLQVRALFHTNHRLRKRFRTLVPPLRVSWSWLAGWLAGQLFGCLDGLDVFFADVATSYRLDDMMSILFPHLCEDVEFLLPSDPDVEMRDDDDNIDFSGVPAAGGSTSGVASASSYAASPSRGNTTAHRPVQENAVAGPSRLG